MSLFSELDVYHDSAERSAAINMAIDEALLEQATRPLLRFYRWDHPALSFGYFGQYEDVAEYATERDMVRRWTGGGIVFHGDDLTYTIVIPEAAELFASSSKAIYSVIHLALRDALIAGGNGVELATAEAPEKSEACFASPVIADVLLNGHKVAGAAHRRTRRGLLHQGSIQNIDVSTELASAFANRLSGKCTEQQISPRLCTRAGEIATLKYGTDSWLRRR
jgi:lipoate-protein ligase A